MAARVSLGHVGRRIEMDVVQHHGHGVLREHDVLLDEVGTLRVGQRLPRQRVLRQVAAGAAVGDHDRSGVDGGSSDQEENHNQVPRKHNEPWCGVADNQTYTR